MRAKIIVAALVLTMSFTLGGCERSGPPAPVFSYNQLGGAGTNGIHTVGKNDTVGGIAQRYNLVLRDILIVNNLQAPYVLQPGQRLKLPAPRTYKVRSRDTVQSVAKLFNTSPSQLVRLNLLSAPYTLKRGQELKLPVVDDQPQSVANVSPGTISITPVDPGAGDAISRPASISSGGVEREELAPPEVTGVSVQAPPTQVAQESLVAKIPDTTPARAGSKFIMPVKGAIISGYGPKAGGLHNDGINIRAARGTPVQSAENGVVVYAGTMKGYGNMVLVRHADRWMTAYAHLDNITVQRGQTVMRGNSIGTVGDSGTVQEPQLHFEIRRGTEALNPEKYM